MQVDQVDKVLGDDELALQGKHIAGLLDNHAQDLSMRALKQLENGREIAVKMHAKKMAGGQLSGATLNQDGSINGIYAWAEHHRVATTGLLLGAIITGFVLMQALQKNNEQGDAFLLGAELPPEAFVDVGFEPSLNNKLVKL
jgi:hypothetical protein